MMLETLAWGWHYYGKLTDYSLKIYFHSNLSKAVAAVVTSWKHYPEILSWLKDVAQTYIQPGSQTKEEVTAAVIQKLAEGWKDDPDILPILKTCAQFGKSSIVRVTAVHELAKGWKDDPDILPILKTCIQTDDSFVRWVAVYELATGWKDQPGMFELFYNRAINDPFVRQKNYPNPRGIALRAIIEQYPDHPLALPLLRDRAENDPDEQVREFAKKNLAELEGVAQEPIEEVRSEI